MRYELMYSRACFGVSQILRRSLTDSDLAAHFIEQGRILLQGPDRKYRPAFGAMDRIIWVITEKAGFLDPRRHITLGVLPEIAVERSRPAPVCTDHEEIWQRHCETPFLESLRAGFECGSLIELTLYRR